MTPENFLKIGWIGCGTHAQAMLLPQLSRYPIELAALCDNNAENLAVTARRYGVTNTYSDYRELLRHPGLDAVGMAVGPGLHTEMAIAALERGVAVFMEKPPGRDVSDALRIEQAARASGRPVVLGFMKRFASGYRIARNIVKHEDFGSVLGFYGQYMTAPTYFSGDAGYSGFYLHHCVHYMDMLNYLAGPVSAIRTRSNEAAPGKLLLHVDIAFSSGAIGSVIMGTIQARSTPMEFIQVMGDQRRVEIDNISRVYHYRAPSFKCSDPLATLDDHTDTLTWQPNLTVAADEDHKGYHALLGHFIRLLKDEDYSSDLPVIADGVTAMRCLEAMIRSRDSGELEDIGQ
jgi:myo-inositol 2-dehydrogenase/D-chiro-inositol 1-dehydrogenase